MPQTRKAFIMRLDATDVRNLRAAGLDVVEISGWQSRGRPGPHDPKGILCHHTGGKPDSETYARWMALTGRPDLPAPLAQIGLSRKGTVYIQAAGRSNHAGRAKRLRAWMTSSDGNTIMLGIEAMNTGSEGWSATQRAAYVTLVAVLCKRRGWDSTRVLAHKETSYTGKPDPGGLNMATFRADVDKRIASLGKPATPPAKPPVRPPVKPPVKPAPRVPAYPGMTKPSKRASGATRAFQMRLKARGWPISTDGVHGPKTTAALKAFQRQVRLTPDGIGGPVTWRALWTAPITSK